MLAPDDRVNFLDLLRPPEGAVLTHAVGTTFALDLLSSLQVPLAISGGSSTDLSDHIAVLAALRTTIDKIDIFHQCGQIIVPARPIRIMSLLEPAVHAITPGHGHAFRPQVWLARYERDEEIHLRLLVLTRDLTQDTGWDVVVALDGFVARHPFAVNRPLARLIQHLATSTVVPLAADRRQRLVDLSEELRYAVWEVPSDFDELGFHSLGIPGVRPSADFSGDRLVVVSPALDARGLHRLTADITGALAIVSTQTALDGLEPGQLSDDATCFVPRAAADIPPSGDRPTAGNSISGLHANLFGVERGSQVSLFVGSTTATHAAFAGDIGFLVQLHGRAKTVGIDVLLGEDALGSVLVRSVPGDDRLPAERSSAEDLESYLREIASIPIDITVRRTGPAYDFSVSSTDPVPSRPGVAITVAPLTAPSRTRRVKPAQPISCGFDGLDKADITAFFVVRVKARRRGSHASAVIKARLEQDVVGRATAVAREEIPTPEAFRALLDILLPVMPAEAAGDRHRTSIPSQPNPNVPQLGIGLFEMLTQTAAQWPKRFDSIRDIVDDIIGDDDPDGILPPGFRELWQTINDAVGEVTSASE